MIRKLHQLIVGESFKLFGREFVKVDCQDLNLDNIYLLLPDKEKNDPGYKLVLIEENHTVSMDIVLITPAPRSQP